MKRAGTTLDALRHGYEREARTAALCTQLRALGATAEEVDYALEAADEIRQLSASTIWSGDDLYFGALEQCVRDLREGVPLVLWKARMQRAAVA